MSEHIKNIMPVIYHSNDPDLIVSLWKTLADTVAEDEYAFARAFQEVIDPDTAPIDFVEVMLKSLGNPFVTAGLTDIQKRKLARLLIAIYKQKGHARGIVNAIRFLTGIEVEVVDPHKSFEDGWQVGLSEVGISTYAGGHRTYKNMLDYSEDFSQSVWTKSNVTVDSASIQGPPPWGRLADTFDMSTPSASVYQSATPHEIAETDFTGSIWLRASANTSIDAIIRSVDNPTDQTVTTLNITTAWQRFEFHHQFAPGATGNVRFLLNSDAGVAQDIYAFGAQLTRGDLKQGYFRTTNDGEDTDEVGPWAYHIFIVSPVTLTENQRGIFTIIVDFMKTAHVHYDIVEPGSDLFVDHWEVALSSIGVNNFVH